MRVVAEGAWVAGGQVVSALAAVVSIRIMTELLTPEAFGQLTLLLGVTALAVGLSVNPRLQALMRYYADWSRADQVGALRRVGTEMIAGPVAIAVVAIVGGWLFAGPAFGGIWYTGLLIAALLIVDGLRLFELALFSAARRQRAAALIYAADAWSRPIMAIAAVLAFGSSSNVALAGYVAGSALVVAFMRVAVRLEGVVSNEPAAGQAQSSVGSQADLAKAIRRYAMPLAPLAIFGWVSGMGDRYVIGNLLGLEHAGLYAAAYGLASRPFMMLYGISELTMRPILQNAVAAGNLELIARAKRSFLLIVASGATFGVVCFFLLSAPVGDLFLAAEYRSATQLMPWIASGYALFVVSNVFSRFCYTFDNTRAVLVLTVAGAVIGLAVMVPVVIFFGLYGAASAVPVRFAIELLLSSFLARSAEREFIAKSANKYQGY